MNLELFIFAALLGGSFTILLIKISDKYKISFLTQLLCGLMLSGILGLYGEVLDTIKTNHSELMEYLKSSNTKIEDLNYSKDQ